MSGIMNRLVMAKFIQQSDTKKIIIMKKTKFKLNQSDQSIEIKI